MRIDVTDKVNSYVSDLVIKIFGSDAVLGTKWLDNGALVISYYNAKASLQHTIPQNTFNVNTLFIENGRFYGEKEFYSPENVFSVYKHLAPGLIFKDKCFIKDVDQIWLVCVSDNYKLHIKVNSIDLNCKKIEFFNYKGIRPCN